MSRQFYRTELVFQISSTPNMTVPNTLTPATLDSVEPVWFDRFRVEEAEVRYQQHLADQHSGLVVKKRKNRSRKKKNKSDSSPSNAEVEVTTPGEETVQNKKAEKPEKSGEKKGGRGKQAQNARTPPAESNNKKKGGKSVSEGTSSILNEIARARQNIQNSLSIPGEGLQVGTSVGHAEVFARLSTLEQENKDLRKVTNDLKALVLKLESRVVSLEKGGAAPSNSPAKPVQKVEEEDDDDDDDDDDDIDLFGSDDEADAAAEKLKEERLKKYQEKKSKKPALVAKSMIILDIKPWDDETDMAEVEKCVRSIATDGLTWGQSKLVPLAYGIKKLQISSVVEDDKVGTDFLEEKITEFEDYVQSVDIAAFNKL
ncbi:elongation factor 1-delta-like isoform X2 [Branchiostoma floridae]|uniref:Elongation factor 1-delta n=1 Tax=Branchiostoma floridae TaxID=7739 RepID=A0A9J7KHH7_BRAFL|nr:elongation factor 1-delta-like isoform X2 [Branchiostoma floridae]